MRMMLVVMNPELHRLPGCPHIAAVSVWPGHSVTVHKSVVSLREEAGRSSKMSGHMPCASAGAEGGRGGGEGGRGGRGVAGQLGAYGGR